MTALSQFLTELRRRRVIRVVVLYAIAGWIIVQVAATVLPELHVPQWSVTLVIVLVALGLPLAAILAWAFDVGESGLKRTTASEAGAGTAAAHVSVPVVLAGGPTALPVASPSEQPILAPMPSITASSDRMDRDRRCSIAVLPFANLTGERREGISRRRFGRGADPHAGGGSGPARSVAHLVVRLSWARHRPAPDREGTRGEDGAGGQRPRRR